MEFNFEKEIICLCGNIYEINDFQEHYKNCNEFKDGFESFDNTLSKLIKNCSEPKEQLLLIRSVFLQYIKRLDRKIKGNYVEISSSFKKIFSKAVNEGNNNQNDEDKLNHKQKNENQDDNRINGYEQKFSFDNNNIK